MAADDLSAPLGQSTAKKPRFKFPVRPSHVIAGVLGFALLVFGGWALVADDPFGGEPMVIVSADPRAPAPVAKAGEPDKPGAAPVGAAAPAPAGPATAQTGDNGAAPGAASVTIIDGMSGKRQEVPIGSAENKSPAPTIDQRRRAMAPSRKWPPTAPGRRMSMRVRSSRT